MSMETTRSKQQWNGNGTTTAFAFNTYVPAVGDLKVYISSSSDEHATGTLQVYTTEYTVSLASVTRWATVNMVTAPASGERLTVVLGVDLTNPTTFTDFDGIPGPTFEETVNRLTTQIKQINERVKHCYRAPIWSNFGEADTQTENPEAHGGEYVGVDDDGEVMQFSEPAGGGGGGAVGDIYLGGSVDVTVADSPYTPDEDDTGDLHRCVTTASAISIVLPDLDSMATDVRFPIVKDSGADGDVVVTASSGQLISGAASYTIDTRWKVVTFFGDKSESKWTAIGGAASPASANTDRFSGDGVDTTFTLSGEPAVEQNTQVFINGVYQQKDTYSLSGTTLTFSTAPISGTDNIEVNWMQSEAIGTPSDGTVTAASHAPQAVGKVLVGTGASTPPAWVTMSGDASIDASGVVAVTGSSIVPSDITLTTGSIIIGAAGVGAALDVKTSGRIVVGNGTTGVLVAVSGDVTLASNGAVTIANDAVSNAKLADITRGSVKVGGAANAPTDLDAKTSGQILVGDGTDVLSVAVSGDVTLAANGAVTIANNAITTGKILNDAVTLAKMADLARGSIIVGGAADAPTALDAKTSGQILVGDGTDLASVAVSGDATLAANGALTIAANAVTLAKLDDITRGSIIVGGVGGAPTLLDANDSGKILVGDGTDLLSVAMSGDATLAANGAITVAAGAIDPGMLNQTLTTIAPSGSNITPDLTAGFYHQVTLGAGTPYTMVNPASLPVGIYSLDVIQDGTGTRLISTWGTAYVFPGGVEPVFSTAAGTVDSLVLRCNGTTIKVNYDFGYI